MGCGSNVINTLGKHPLLRQRITALAINWACPTMHTVEHTIVSTQRPQSAGTSSRPRPSQHARQPTGPPAAGHVRPAQRITLCCRSRSGSSGFRSLSSALWPLTRRTLGSIIDVGRRQHFGARRGNRHARTLVGGPGLPQGHLDYPGVVPRAGFHQAPVEKMSVSASTVSEAIRKLSDPGPGRSRPLRIHRPDRQRPRRRRLHGPAAPVDRDLSGSGTRIRLGRSPRRGRSPRTRRFRSDDLADGTPNWASRT